MSRFSLLFRIILSLAKFFLFSGERYPLVNGKASGLVAWSKFFKHFWDFVLEGGYEIKQRSDGRPIYYRFAKPQRNDFPEMLELFSRGLSGLALGDEQAIVPIPKEEDASSLSAILMDEDYYKVVYDFREVAGDVSLAELAMEWTIQVHTASDRSRAYASSDTSHTNLAIGEIQVLSMA